MPKKDITGQRFGRLIAINPTTERCGTFVMWECVCDCGIKKLISSRNLISGHTQSCGCLNKELLRERGRARIKDITGQRFGRLVIAKRLEGKNVECVCDCGKTTIVQIRNLYGERPTKSCGCFQSEYLDKDQYEAGGFINGTSIGHVSSDKPWKTNTSGAKGVYWDKSRGKWCASIGFKGKGYHLGRYKEKNDAIKARKQAEEMLFEPFLEWYNENFKNKSQNCELCHEKQAKSEPCGE